MEARYSLAGLLERQFSDLEIDQGWVMYKYKYKGQARPPFNQDQIG